MLRVLSATLFVLCFICPAFAQEDPEFAGTKSSDPVTDAAAPVGESPVFVSTAAVSSPTFEWKGAATDSLKMLLMQNAIRYAIQPKTREALSGPYFKDYLRTLKEPRRGFMDGDSGLTNFLLHPVQGSTSYHIARNHGASRTQAFFWGVAYSTHFELSPLGEAGFGNVPISPVDLIVTPSAGFLLGSAEEWLLRKLSGKTSIGARIARIALAGRTFSQLAAMKRYP